MSTPASRSRKRKSEAMTSAEAVGAVDDAVPMEGVEDEATQQANERPSKKAKLEVPKEEKTSPTTSAGSERPEANVLLEELRDQASAELKVGLARLAAERELALKEMLILKKGASLASFDPSGAAILALAEEYHTKHPFLLEVEKELDEPWSEDDEEQIKTTKADLFPSTILAAAGVIPTVSSGPSSTNFSSTTVPGASSSNGAVHSVGSPIPSSSASYSMTTRRANSPSPAVSVSSPGAASASAKVVSGAVTATTSTKPKGGKAAATKRGPGRPPKVRDEMMPDMAAVPAKMIQTTANAISSSSARSSSPSGALSAATMSSPSGIATRSKPIVALKKTPAAAPSSKPSKTAGAASSNASDSALAARMTYLPFLTRPSGSGAGSSTTTNPPFRKRAAFPWTEAELFANCESVFDLPSPMTMNPTWVDRAKQDSQSLEKISTLQKEGKLSTKRMQPAIEPPRNKTHWDYLLKEMAWMAEDYKGDRAWRIETAKKFAREAKKFHVEKARQIVRVQRDREKALRDKARWIARQVTAFWHDVEQLIVFKHRSSLDKHKKIAMDKNLDFFVQQTQQYSASLAIDLQGAPAPSPAPPSSSPAPTAPAKSSNSMEIDEESSALTAEPPASVDASTPAAESSTLASSTTQAKPADEGLDLDHLDDEEFEPAAHQLDEPDDEATIAAHEAEIHAEQMADLKEAGHEDETAMLTAESEMPLEEILKSYQTTATEEEGEEDETPKEDGDDYGSESGSDNGDEDEEDAHREAEDRAKFGADFFARVAAHDPVATEQQHQNDKERLQAAAAEAQTIQPTGFTLATTQVKTPVPFLLQGTLREYQHIGLEWMVTMYEKRLNGILADEMGLGKTIMTISLLAHLACNGHWGPHLIVVPTSVLLNWEMELKRWCPQLKVLTYFGTPRQRKQKRTGWTKPNAFHVCLTSYKLVLQDVQSFKRMKWFYLILDEAHNIKNYKSQSWQALLNFRTRRRLLLTGTPLQNNLMELWALMHFLMPHIFQSHKEFKDWFSNPVNSMIEGTSNYSDELIRRLHSILRPFMLRRLKKDVEKQLPGKFEHVVMCKLSKRQRLLYDEYMSTGAVQSTLKGGNYLGVANVLMQLRKVCNHPDLFEGRPIISPFDQVGLEFNAPSSIVHILDDDDPFQASNRLLDRTQSETDAAEGTSLLATKPQLKSTFHPRSLVADVIALKQSSQRVQQLPSLGTPFALQTYSPALARATPIHIPNSSAATPTFLARLTTSSDMAPPSSSKSSKAHAASLDSAHLKGRLSTLTQMNNAQVEKRISEAEERLAHFAYVSELRSKSQPLVVSSETVDMLLEDVAILKQHALALRANPARFLDYSQSSDALVLSPEQRLDQLQHIIENFVCYIPKARAPPIRMRTAHVSSPSLDAKEKFSAEELKQAVAPKLDLMHSAHVRTQIYFPDKRLIQFDCGKLQILAELLRHLKKDGHRCLIFTQMTRMLDVLEAFINLHGYTYLRLDGATKVEQRQKMMERFNHDKRVFLFILSTRSGGLGINLVGADTVIFYDTDWNPAMDAQAQDRCHRIGQTREVHIYRLISEHTIEENILKKAKQKRQLDNIIKEGNFTTDFFKKVDIREMVRESVSADRPALTSSAEQHNENGSPDILIPGTTAASAATNSSNPEALLDNPDLEAALLQAEDAADIEAFKAVRREIAAEQKIDDAEGEDEDETPEWEAKLSSVHKMAMRYVELVNPSLDKNALAYAHQQIADEEATWKDEAVKRLKMGRKLWHGDEASDDDDESDEDNDDASEDDENDDSDDGSKKTKKKPTKKRKKTFTKPQRKKPKLAEVDEEGGDAEEEEEPVSDEEESDAEPEEEVDGDDLDDDLDDNADEDGDGEDAAGEEGEGEEEDDAAMDDQGGEDEEEGQEDEVPEANGNEEADEAMEGSCDRPLTSTTKNTTSLTTKKTVSNSRSTASNSSSLDDSFEYPMLYQVTDMQSELETRYPGESLCDIPFGLVDPDQEEIYLPPSSQLPGLLDLLSETSLASGDDYGEDEWSDASSSSTTATHTFSPAAKRQLESDLRLLSELDDASRLCLFLKPITEIGMYKELVEMERNKLIAGTASSSFYRNLMVAKSYEGQSESPPESCQETLRHLNPLATATWTHEEDACILDTMREYWIPSGSEDQIPWTLICDALVPLAPPHTTRTPLQVIARWYDFLLPKQASCRVRMGFNAKASGFRCPKEIGSRLLQLLPPSHLVLPQEYRPLNFVLQSSHSLFNTVSPQMEEKISAAAAAKNTVLDIFSLKHATDATPSHHAVQSRLPDFKMFIPRSSASQATKPIPGQKQEFDIMQTINPCLVFAASKTMRYDKPDMPATPTYTTPATPGPATAHQTAPARAQPPGGFSTPASAQAYPKIPANRPPGVGPNQPQMASAVGQIRSTGPQPFHPGYPSQAIPPNPTAVGRYPYPMPSGTAPQGYAQPPPRNVSATSLPQGHPPAGTVISTSYPPQGLAARTPGPPNVAVTPGTAPAPVKRNVAATPKGTSTPSANATNITPEMAAYMRAQQQASAMGYAGGQGMPNSSAPGAVRAAGTSPGITQQPRTANTTLAGQAKVAPTAASVPQSGPTYGTPAQQPRYYSPQSSTQVPQYAAPTQQAGQARSAMPGAYPAGTPKYAPPQGYQQPAGGQTYAQQHYAQQQNLQSGAYKQSTSAPGTIQYGQPKGTSLVAGQYVANATPTPGTMNFSGNIAAPAKAGVVPQSQPKIGIAPGGSAKSMPGAVPVGSAQVPLGHQGVPKMSHPSIAKAPMTAGPNTATTAPSQTPVPSVAQLADYIIRTDPSSRPAVHDIITHATSDQARVASLRALLSTVIQRQKASKPGIAMPGAPKGPFQ